jgi:hypothetical protein
MPPMIHVATVHWQIAKWIVVQHDYLARHIAEPYRVWGSLEGIDETYTKWFDHVVPSLGTHAAKLNLLALAIREVAAPDDVILFMDGDAFPIADPMPVIRAALNESVLVAVRRDENAGDPQPHPSFCATKVESWDELHGDWSKGYPWAANPESGPPISDVGGNLLFALQSRNMPWTPLTRSNRHNLHPLWFGVYGGIVYHHGAGFRPRKMMSRHDSREIRARLPPRLSRLGRWWRRQQVGRRKAQRERENAQLSEHVFQQLTRDPEFFRQFL